MITRLCGKTAAEAGAVINSGHPQAVKLSGYLELYGADSRDYVFYLFTQDENPCAAGLLRYGNLLLFGDRGDTDELAYFIQSNREISAVSICGGISGGVCDKLSREWGIDKGTIFVFDGEAKPEREAESSEDFEKIYKILSASFSEKVFPEAGYQLWLCEMSHAVRHGQSEAYILDGRATVSILFDNGRSAVIGQVGVLPSAQGQGVGRQAVLSVVSKLKKTGRMVYVYSRNGRTDGFYRSLGFKEYGQWFEMTRL